MGLELNALSIDFHLIGRDFIYRYFLQYAFNDIERVGYIVQTHTYT